MAGFASLLFMVSLICCVLSVISPTFRKAIKIESRRKAVLVFAFTTVMCSLLVSALDPITPSPASVVEKISPITPFPTLEPSTTPITTPAPLVVFNIPALYSLNIDQIRTRLGSPVDGQPEPTELQLQLFDEWENMFVMDNYSLLITFRPIDRTIIDFFLTETDKSTCDPIMLILVGGLNNESDSSNITVVKNIGDPTKCTGIKISPRV